MVITRKILVGELVLLPRFNSIRHGDFKSLGHLFFCRMSMKMTGLLGTSSLEEQCLQQIYFFIFRLVRHSICWPLVISPHFVFSLRDYFLLYFAVLSGGKYNRSWRYMIYPQFHTYFLSLALQVAMSDVFLIIIFILTLAYIMSSSLATVERVTNCFWHQKRVISYS